MHAQMRGRPPNQNNRGIPPPQVKKDELSDLLRDIEHFFKSQDERPNSRLDPSQYSRPSLTLKTDSVFATKNKKHHTPGIAELEMMLTMRNWMEDKGDEFHRYQTFEFIFSSESLKKNINRLEFLTSLLSFAISTYSSKLLEAGALWLKTTNKQFSIDVAERLTSDFSHSIPEGGDLLKLHQSSPRFASMLISTWGSMYRHTLPTPFILTVIGTWLEADSTVLFTPLNVRSNLWLTVNKPEHYSEEYIKSCGAADLIAWTIRLSFTLERETSAKFHWLVLKSISGADRVVKRMAKNLPSQNLVKIWTRQDVHSLVGEMMEKGKEHKEQIDKAGNAVANTHMEIAVDRFAQLCQAAKFSGVLKDCTAAQFQSLCDILPTTKLLNMVVGLR